MGKRFNYYSFIVRTFLIKSLLKLINILGKLIIPSPRKKSLFIYYYSEKVALNSLSYSYGNTGKRTFTLESLKSWGPDYNWGELIEDIKVNGIKHPPIAVKDTRGPTNIMEILDGNHRTKIWELLYGVDCEILVDIYVSSDFLQYTKDSNKLKKNLMTERLLTIKNKTYAQE